MQQGWDTPRCSAFLFFAQDLHHGAQLLWWLDDGLAEREERESTRSMSIYKDFNVWFWDWESSDIIGDHGANEAVFYA